MSPSTQSVDSSCSFESVRNSVLAGYTAGVCGTLVGHPFDSLKVQMQTQQQRQISSHAGVRPPPTSPNSLQFPAGARSRGMHTLVLSGSKYMSYHQLRSLYAGISAPLLTVGLVQSINFAIYDATRRLLYSRQGNGDGNRHYLNNDPILNVAISSSVAGAVLAVFTSPMLIVKTAQQTIPGLGFQDAFRRAWQTGMFVGMGPHVLSEIMGRAAYFCAYESAKRAMVQSRTQDTNACPTLPERMLSAAVSGILCWSIIFPLDAVRCRIYYAHAIQSEHSARTGWTMTKEMYRQGGLRCFYRGFTVTVMRAGPVSAAVLPMYDKALELLNQNSH